MANKWVEGFESHISTSQLERKYASVSGSISSDAGRVFGTAGQPQAAVLVTPSLGLDNTWTLGFGVRLSSHTTLVNSGAQGLYLEKGSAEQLHLEMLSTSGTGFQWRLMRGATEIAISASFTFGVWHYFELKVTIRPGTDGVYELRRNGVVDFSGSGINLADEGTDGADIFALRYTSNVTGNLSYDDMYLNDSTTADSNTFLGPSIVEGFEMTATGTTNDFTNDSGGAQTANWDQVNDSPSATDESGAGGTVSSDTNTHKDTYVVSGLAQVTGNIHAVQVGIQAAMAAAGSRNLKFIYRDPGDTEADGDTFVVDDTNYDEFVDNFDRNPVTGAIWDVDDINNGEFGFEVVS